MIFFAAVHDYYLNRNKVEADDAGENIRRVIQEVEDYIHEEWY